MSDLYIEKVGSKFTRLFRRSGAGLGIEVPPYFDIVDNNKVGYLKGYLLRYSKERDSKTGSKNLKANYFNMAVLSAESIVARHHRIRTIVFLVRTFDEFAVSWSMVKGSNMTLRKASEAAARSLDGDAEIKSLLER